MINSYVILFYKNNHSINPVILSDFLKQNTCTAAERLIETVLSVNCISKALQRHSQLGQLSDIYINTKLGESIFSNELKMAHPQIGISRACWTKGVEPTSNQPWVITLDR